MRILVTGASGFVGRHLLRALQDANHDVIVDRFDVCHRELVRAAISRVNPDGIIHLAAQSSVKVSWRDPEDTLATNVTGTRHVLEAVRDLTPRCRVLTIGSAEEYDAPMDGSLLNEDATCDPRNPYALSKYVVFELGCQLAQKSPMNIIHVRPFNHIGPGQRREFVVPDFAYQLVRIQKGLQAPTLQVGNLSAVRDFTDVRDVVQGYRLLIEKGQPGRVYNIASGQGHSVQELVDLMMQLLHVSVELQVIPERLRPIDVPVLVGDATRIRNELVWKPTYTIEDTLRDVLLEQGAVFEHY